MSKFKVRDKVRCIDDGGGVFIKKGSCYIVTEVLKNGNVYLRGLSNGVGSYPHRFEKVKPNPRKQ
jgi:hypothetical protein